MKRSHEAPSDEVKTPKRARVASTGNPQLMKRYPISFSTKEHIMPETYEESERKLRKEQKKSHPNPDVYLPLMSQTFDIRRQYIVSEADCARDIMDKYHFMKIESTVRCIHIRLGV